MDKQLPQRVLFKGNDDCYMAAVILPGENDISLQFYVLPEDKNARRCSFTIHTNGDGTIRLQSDYYGTFWRRTPKWIWADSQDQTSNNRDTLFRPVKLDGDGMYALQNVGNGNYCHRSYSCLSASSPSIHMEARLKLEEAVLSRRIYDVSYLTRDATINGKKLITLITQDTVNRGSRDCKETIALDYKVTKETKWDSSVSIKFGVKTTVTGGIPAVTSGSVEVGTEFAFSYTWGEAVTSTEEHSTSCEVVVPPNTKVTVSLLATEAICEVPFVYSQEDVLTNGDKVVYKLYDGIYRGVNSYGFETNISEQKL